MIFPIQFFDNFVCFIISQDLYAIIFERITRFSLLPLEEIKFIAIVNSIFHVSDFLRLFMMSFKRGLILLRYSSIDSVLFLSPLPSYSI